MAQVAAAFPLVVARERETAAPWYVWCSVLAVTSSMVGIHWDISWHRTIGRDTFLTPAHIAIYLCGVLAGISCGYLILATTFSKAAEYLRESSVKLWGFRGPLGSFIAAWGGIAMLTSAPFDDWWHSAYGLDVKIISPPHMVLAVGIFAVQLGTVMLVLGRMNRAEGSNRKLLEYLFIFLAGLSVVNVATIVMEYTFRVNMHSAMYYRAAATALPFFLFGLARACSTRWAATKVALVYMVFWQSMNVILSQFSAEPKLGPVFNPVTHFVPSYFPFLLVVPAAAVDLLLERTERWKTLFKGWLAGFVFVAVLLAVQWPMGNFLLSAWSRNWFFYTHLHDYRTGPGSYNSRHLFFPWERTPAEFWTNLALAFLIAGMMTWMAMHWGNWLRRVRR